LVGAVVKRDHPEQLSALSTLLRYHKNGTLSLVASTEVLTEIQGLPSQHQGPHREVYTQLLQLPGSNVTWLEPATATPSVQTDPLYSRIARILPDEMDARHVFQALKQSVPYFATVDQRTILKHSRSLEAEFPVRFGKPTDVLGWLELPSSSSGVSNREDR
jgi:hypothetical protein